MSNSISSIRSRQFLGDDERNLQPSATKGSEKTGASKASGKSEPTRSPTQPTTEMTTGRTYAAAEQQRAKDPAFQRFLDTSMREHVQNAASGLAATTKPLGVSVSDAQCKQLSGDLKKLEGSLAQLSKDLGAAAGPLASHPAVRGVVDAHFAYTRGALALVGGAATRNAIAISGAILTLAPAIDGELTALRTLAAASKEDPALRKTLAPLQADVQRVLQDAEKVASDLSSLR